MDLRSGCWANALGETFLECFPSRLGFLEQATDKQELGILPNGSPESWAMALGFCR